MKITFLGQAGLLFEIDGKKIMIDPYLSDSVEKINPKNFRRQAIDPRFLEMTPDVLMFTHIHLDHFDPETVSHYLNVERHILVLCPYSTWQEARKFGGDHNYVMFNRGASWTYGNILFHAVPAEHSDREAIGVIITYEGKHYYVTGDTLYHEEIFAALPHEIEAVFLPINGVGNNMNPEDAARFAARIGAKKVVPLHFGLFDEMTGEELRLQNKIIPKIYEEIVL